MQAKNILGLLSTLFLCFLVIQSCTRDDELETLIPPSTFEYGEDIVKVSEGFSFDKTHSSVRWETAYLGTAALLTGRFNDFEFGIEFDEDNPSNTSISGTVVLSSVNTGEPGRVQGCLLGTFATETSDEATFVSTSVEKDEKGAYTLKGDLTFHGVTDEVSGTLEYLGTTFYGTDSGIYGAPFSLAGFVVTFEFNAKSVFNIDSGNIADRVVVIGSGQFKKSE